MQFYIALIHKEADSDYGVSFPDFPGAITAGNTLDEARQMAAEALAFHIEGMVADNEAVPEPSSLEAIMSDPENRDGVAILVGVGPLNAKAVRINITMQEDILREVDAYSEANGLTRSGFLAKAARAAIAGRVLERA
jgi:predicted RNase H-like HicB family nuclease